MRGVVAKVASDHEFWRAVCTKRSESDSDEQVVGLVCFAALEIANDEALKYGERGCPTPAKVTVCVYLSPRTQYLSSSFVGECSSHCFSGTRFRNNSRIGMLR